MQFNGSIAANTIQSNTITMGDLIIKPDGITYKGEVVNDAGTVYRALLEVLEGRATIAPAALPHDRRSQARPKPALEFPTEDGALRADL